MNLEPHSLRLFAPLMVLGDLGLVISFKAWYPKSKLFQIRYQKVQTMPVQDEIACFLCLLFSLSHKWEDRAWGNSSWQKQTFECVVPSPMIMVQAIELYMYAVSP